jgi:hypothetical protein
MSERDLCPLTPVAVLLLPVVLLRITPARLRVLVSLFGVPETNFIELRVSAVSQEGRRTVTSFISAG